MRERESARGQTGSKHQRIIYLLPRSLIQTFQMSLCRACVSLRIPNFVFQNNYQRENMSIYEYESIKMYEYAYLPMYIYINIHTYTHVHTHKHIRINFLCNFADI